MAVTLNVRVNSSLGDHIARQLGEHGEYDNASEYVRDLIRRDKARKDEAALARLKAELQDAFAQPESSYQELTAEEVFRRNGM